MNNQSVRKWESETLKKSVTIKRYAVLSGTTIFVYNKRDGVKHRQQTVQDLYFTDTDVINQDQNDVYRVRLDKGDWEWFDIDTGDICDVTIKSRKQLNPIASNELELLSSEVERVLAQTAVKSGYSGSGSNPNPYNKISMRPNPMSNDELLDQIKKYINDKHIK